MATFYKHFGKPEYWEENYASDKRHFEWMQDYKKLRDILSQHVPKKGSIILNVGCGTTKIPELMYNDGYKFIINVDNSKHCIEHMRTLYPKMPKTFQFLKMDCLEMDFESEIFTTVLDKGLLDSISTGYRSFENCTKYIREIYRVMKKQSNYICISHNPNRIEEYFSKSGVEWKSIQLIKTYKPVFEREQNLIRKEFISKEVLDKIEEKKRVRIREVDKDVIDAWEIVPDDEMSEFKPTVKKRIVLNPEGATMPEVPCHYFYILTKFVEDEFEEEDEGDAEEEEGED